MSGQGAGARPAETSVPLKTWIAVGAALLGAFMAVLNIQVTNSSLPDIEGGLGTGGVNGTWISTAYLIGEIVIIPMTAFLSRVFSLRRYMIASTALFLLMSVACAQATNLPEMIALRGLQGFFGGVLIPLAFTIIVSVLPPAKQPMGFAGFAVTATFAPAIGPTIGGWLTDNYGWQTIFYMNLVPGVLMLSGLIYALPSSAPKLNLLRHGDWLGIVLMAIGLATFQTILDEGNVDDWFGSPEIVHLSIISALALGAFLIVELRVKAPLVRLRLLGRRNFGFATLSNFMLGFALYGAAYLLPQYLAVAQGFDAQQSGEVVAWTGLPQLLVIPFVPYLMRKFDLRLVVSAGFTIFAASCFMCLNLDPNIAGPQMLVADVIRAIGQALTITPLSAVAMVGITKDEAGDASGLFNMTRNLGGAIGTAAVETYFTQREQYHSFIINAHVSLYAPATQARLAGLQHYFMLNGSDNLGATMSRAIQAVGATIKAQSTIMGYGDCFGLLGAVMASAVVSVALLKRGPSGGGGGAH
jgi:DHA2 family multidrug resistance protein